MNKLRKFVFFFKTADEYNSPCLNMKYVAQYQSLFLQDLNDNRNVKSLENFTIFVYFIRTQG